MRVPINPDYGRGRISETNRGRLARFLAYDALYTRLEFPGVWLDSDNIEYVIPAEIQRTCESKKCNGFESAWLLAPLAQNVPPGTCVGLRYNCRNCDSPFHVWFRWDHIYSDKERARIGGAKMLDGILVQAGGAPLGDHESIEGRFRFEKAGQYPALSVIIPRDLSDALGDHAKLYRQAVVSRNQGYGIGALAYLRRVVEETMNEMLTLLVAALEETGAEAEVVRRVEDVKREHTFERKAEVAAAVLPDALKPHGFNPFSSLHSLYSEGVHVQTDEECVDIFDQMREDMGIIFQMLKSHVAERRHYRDAASRFQTRASKKPKK